MKQINLCCLLFALLMGCLYSQTLNGNKVVEPSGTAVAQKNSSSYEYANINIGKEIYNSATYKYRTWYECNLGDIPDNATITNVKVTYNADNSGSGYSFKLTRLSSVPTSPEAGWSAVGSGSSLETGLDYGSYFFDSNNIKTAVQNALSGNTLIIGALSENESTTGSTSNISTFKLDIDYSYPTTSLDITVQNSLEGGSGGNIGVAIYPSSAVSHSSPYSFTAYEEDRLNLAAYDNQSVSSKVWFFNDTEYGYRDSEWKKGSSFLSYSSSFATTALTSNDDDATFTAYLRTTSYTTSGAMSSDELVWTSISLSGDVTVADGVTLTVSSTGTINLNGHSIICQGTGKVVNNGTISYCVSYITEGSDYKGYYPTLASALSNAASGQTVHVSWSNTLSDDEEVPTGVTLDIHSGKTLTLNGHQIKCAGSGKILKNGTVSGYIHHAKSGSDYKGFFPSSTTIQDIIDLAPSGWEIFIGWGTFSENINMKSNVDLVGNSSPCPTLDGNITFYNDDYAELTDFKVNGSISVNSSDNVVISDVLSNNSNCYISATGSVFDVEDSDFNLSQSNGVNVYSFSDAYLWDSSIKNKSSNGVVVTQGSTAYLDEVSFCSNNWDIMDAAASYIDCVNCTFSGATEGSTVGSGVWWDYWTYCGLIKGSVNDGENDVSAQTERETGPARQDYEKALEKYRGIRMQLREDRKAKKSSSPQKYESDYNDAVSQFKDVVAKYPESSYAILSLNHISTSYRALKEYVELEDYVQSIEENKNLETLRPYAQFALVQSYIDLTKPQKAIDLLDQILEDYPDHELVVELLYSKGLIYKYDLRDQEKAEKMFKTIIANYPDHPMAQAAQDELINQEGPKEGEADATVEPANELAAENYPNPFNPDTQIQFTLPESDYVVVKVYNSLGQEIVTLMDDHIDKGVHLLRWNGRDGADHAVSSGVYFYHIRTKNEILKKKMILLQ